MVSGDNVTVTLTGGPPWGFRLTGGGSMPLQISKIRKKSQAHAQGLREGDAVVSINGIPVHDRSHDQAVDLIDSAGDTLTLQLYRGDADDLGQLLSSNLSPPHLAPIIPVVASSPTVVASTTSSSSSVTLDHGETRREVQEEVSVQKDGNTQRETFVRREHTTTVSSSPIIVSDIAIKDGSTKSISSRSITTNSVTTTAQLSPSSAPSESSRPPPAVSPKPSQPIVIKGPTFKAVPPKIAPAVPPKPTAGPPPVAPKPILLKSSGAVQAPIFTPTKFKVSATAMTYSPGSPYSFGGQENVSPARQQPQVTSGQQPFSPARQQIQVTGGQQPFSPARQQQLQVTGGQQPFSPNNQKPYTPTKQIAYSTNIPKPFGKENLYSQGSSQPFSPASLMSPSASEPTPFSPVSAGTSSPVFNVRNNFGQGVDTWKPNMWLPGQDSAQSKAPRGPQSDDAEVTPKLSIKQRQQMLLQHTSGSHHSLQARQKEPPGFVFPSEEEQQKMSLKRLHVFAPPVEITSEGPVYDHPDSPGVDLGYPYMDSGESGLSSPTSSVVRRKKKMYSDSAFYTDPEKKYPTIEEQMKLCKLISLSLTSAANRKARGAKMFAKRKRKSTKWVHEGQSEWSSSAGDVANLAELDSELSPDEGGDKNLFYFRIPQIKHRVGAPEKNTKMSMRKDEFEKLRLEGARCDHKVVSPGTCFDIVADLKASKGRGGRLFERRKNRADKFIIDESNAKVPLRKTNKLDTLLNSPLKSTKSPWEAAQTNDLGHVDAAFDHLSDLQRTQKLNQILKYSPAPPKPKPLTTSNVEQPIPYTGPRSDLRATSYLPVLQGRNFNRLAKGWQGGGSGVDPHERRASSVSPFTHENIPASSGHSLSSALLDPSAGSRSLPRGSKNQFADYNPRPRAWQSNQGEQGDSSYSCPPSMAASWTSADFEASYPRQNGFGAGGGSGYYASEEIPACDL